MKYNPLPDGAHKSAGSFDNAGRWYPSDDLYNIPGAFSVRSPSRDYPYSYLKHFYSAKFARLLAENDPKKFFRLSGIDPESETGKMVIAEYARKKMGAR